MKNRYIAFTLAEVLITIGIIGIVATLTLPSLIKNYQEHAWKQAWKKNFSVISQAYENVKQDNGGDLSEYFDSTEYNPTVPVVEQMGKYLSVAKACGFPLVSGFYNICGSETDSLTNAYKSQTNQYMDPHEMSHGQYLLNDGTNIYFRTWFPKRMTVWVDVNGYRNKPNAIGKDLFGMTITKTKVMPFGAPDTGLENSCNNGIEKTCLQAYGFHGGSCAGAGCSAEFLYK